MNNIKIRPQLDKLLWEEDKFGIKASKLNLECEITKEFWNELNVEFKKYEMIVINNCGNNFKNNLLIGKLKNCFVADINVQFEKRLSKIKDEKNNSVNITNDKEFDYNLIEIANKSFIYSRFINDPNLDRKKSMCIYSDWTRNSFDKENKYFVTYELYNKSIGFIVFSINNNIATIELVAVDKEHQNKKIGKYMMNEMERFLYETKSGVTLIKVGTQAENENAIRFYQNRGFRLKKINTVYHKWNK